MKYSNTSFDIYLHTHPPRRANIPSDGSHLICFTAAAVESLFLRSVLQRDNFQKPLEIILAHMLNTLLNSKTI